MTDTTWAFAGAPARRRGRPPASDSAVTRERILEAARKVFAESGYEAATFQSIAVEIGLTRPAINNYFPSKPALYAEVAARAGEAVRRAIRLASAAPTLTGQLVAFLRLTYDGPESALAGFLVQSAIEAGHLPQFDGQPRVADHVERFVAEAVSTAVRRGEISADADIAAISEALTGLLWGSAFQLSRAPHGDDAHTERLLGQLEWLLQRG